MAEQKSVKKMVSEMTNDELKEKLRKYECGVLILKTELKKREVMESISKSIKTHATKTQPTRAVKAVKPITAGKKSTNLINATKDDMKQILTKNNIIFKTSSNKTELYEFVKKNNLIRASEELNKLKNNF